MHKDRSWSERISESKSLMQCEIVGAMDMGTSCMKFAS